MLLSPRFLNTASSTLLIALIVLCLAWEAWLAPLHEGGSWMILKVVPLLAAVFGILRGKRYTYQWLSMLILLYFTEGVMRAWGESGLSATLAFFEAALSCALFVTVILYARETAPSRVAARAERPQ